MHVVVSTSGQSRLVVDTGADGNILKCAKIKGTLELEPANSVKIKAVKGGKMQTHGTKMFKLRRKALIFLFPFN